MKKTVFTIVLTISLVIVNGFINAPSFAASTIMGFSPNAGTFNKPFSVNLVINGNGDKFNAAQATVTLSNNFAIQDLTLGDCNFSFLKTPTIQNPSFEGIIVGTYSTSCTVYTLTLVPTTKGNGTISLSNATVKRYGDAAETLSSTNNGTYTLTAALQPPTTLNAHLKNTSQNGLYTLYLSVSGLNHTAVSGATILLTQIETKTQVKAITDKTGVAHFSNLKQGLYDAVVQEGLSKVGEAVVNVTGANHVLSVGISLATQKNNPLMKTNSLLGTISSSPFFLAGILFIGIILGIVIAIFVLKLIGKK